MKKCYVCGTENEDIFTKCVACGADFPESQEELTHEHTVQEYAQEAHEEASGSMGLRLKQNNSTSSASKPQAASKYSYTTAGLGTSQPTYNSQPNRAGYTGGIPSAPSISRQSDNSKVFAGLGLIALVVIAAFVLIFKVGGKAKTGVENRQELPKIFCEALTKQDRQTLDDITPPFAQVDAAKFAAAYKDLEGFEVTFNFVSITGSYEYNKSEIKALQQKLKDDIGSTGRFDQAAEIDYKMEISVTDGKLSQRKTANVKLYAVKYKGKWFMVDNKVIDF